MSLKSQLVKIIKIISKKFSKYSLVAFKKQINWLLRTLFLSNKKRDALNAGFVLPTVAMVALVIVLLTTAILFRSFDRSKNASNLRVNEVVLNAATPAIDRARAKLDKLFNDRRLPRATPADKVLEETLTNYIAEYTLGDETQLKLKYNSETELKTSWLFPVDTDNNGKFDSYTLYGIYFRNPPISGGKYERARNPLEARTPPMVNGNVGNTCKGGNQTSASLVGNTGWFNIGGKLKKSFFVYTANVPITTAKASTSPYEAYKGNRGFSSLEYQQDRVQLPLVNNAVVYEDDLEITPGPQFNLNGRILTNSNLLTGSDYKGVKLYQVSSKDSCFYDDDNAKIIVGGNLGAGSFTSSADLSQNTTVDLYQGKSSNPTNAKVSDNKSVTEEPRLIAYNSLAYVQRINLLVDAQIAKSTSTDPQEVKDGITQEKQRLGLSTYTAAEESSIRRKQLESYFKKRTRRVPYAEIAFGDSAVGTYDKNNVLKGSADTLRPPDTWIYPFAPSDGTTNTNYAKLTLNTSSDKLLPSGTEPNTQQTSGKEKYLGDRALVGNNLPALWWNDTNARFFGGTDPADTQNIAKIVWDAGSGTRTRRTRVQQLADLGSIERDGEWESAAAQKPETPQDLIGGLRVVTGAGIYLPSNLLVSSPKADLDGASTTIWSDLMPVPSGTATDGTKQDSRNKVGNFDYTTVQVSSQPYLRMRATAVYHYKADKYDPKNPKPIACVSSYYDPTDKNTARNQKALPDVSPIDGTDTTILKDSKNDGSSNNGIVYQAPTKATTDYKDLLDYQAKLKYANGRLVNETLKNALAKTAANRTLSEQSAIDTAICAIQILDATLGKPDNTVIPHGTIMEAAFLDARQIKAIHKDVTLGVETFTNADGVNGDGTGTIAKVPDPSSSAPNYDLSKENRQPLEIRATVLDINKLRTTKYGSTTPSQEYLIANSGIIYASREDALLDLSAKSTDGKDVQKLQSPVDFKLDPTRRPNAIMLINGNPLWREKDYRDVEKGLILASNLPVYIKGDFNKHTKEEFKTSLSDTWDNFYSRLESDLDTDFACRPNHPTLKESCKTGDEWRPASILSDAITLLSNNFKLGLRNDGDYDLNNNLGDPTSIEDTTSINKGLKPNGFDTNNANVINAAWYGSDGYPNRNSSYLNNFVTPIQRRRKAPEYLMEVCPKLPVSACDTASDWYVNVETNLKASDIAAGTTFAIATHKAGTTAQAPDSSYMRYPRRVAFKRATTTNEIALDSSLPIIIGIKGGKINQYPLSKFDKTNSPDSQDNALWFRTTTAKKDDTPPKVTPLGTTKQPILSPVLQIQVAFGNDETKYPLLGPDNNQDADWIQIATDTTFNLVAAAGDTPARPNEDNGGLHNFVRFLENWNPVKKVEDAYPARISGSFIQVKRSAYATGPFLAFLSDSGLSDTYTYPINASGGKVSFYLPPKRQWGYDVGLLSQSPDLFAQKLAITPDDKPDEYFREVGRDDTWVQTLLCAKKADDNYAIDDNKQRPDSCKS